MRRECPELLQHRKLAYGPGRSKFAALLEGFKPAENIEQKTMQQALEAAKLDVEAINANWRRYLGER